MNEQLSCVYLIFVTIFMFLIFFTSGLHDRHDFCFFGSYLVFFRGIITKHPHCGLVADLEAETRGSLPLLRGMISFWCHFLEVLHPVVKLRRDISFEDFLALLILLVVNLGVQLAPLSQDK